MPTLKNWFQILNLHPKKHILKKKVFLMYFCPSFTVQNKNSKSIFCGQIIGKQTSDS